MNLAENLDRTARARGRSAAVTLGETALSYADLDLASRRVAGLLAVRGVGVGDRVALVLPDVPEFTALYYGILRLGAVVVPMSPRLAEHEVGLRLRDSGAGTVVVVPSGRAAVEPLARTLGVLVVVLGPDGLPGLLGETEPRDEVEPRDPDDTAVVLYTAGTTGAPRGAELTHGNLARNCEVVVNDLVHLTSEDVVLAGLPLSHALGQTAALNAAVRSGACLALLDDSHDAEAALRTLQDRRVSVLAAGPATYAALLAHPLHADADLSALRVCLSGGAPLPVDVLLAFEEAFGCLVLDGYGLAETSPLTTSNRVDHRRVGSVGTPVLGVDLRVVDARGAEVADGQPGELVVRGPNVMKGYWDHPAATAAAFADGWLSTGDVGVRDADGFFYVVDRTQELISRGPDTVFPREVEDVLHEHRAVDEAAVVGVPHPSLGEEVRAVVTLKPGAVATAGELRAFVKGRVAAHQYPRVVDIVQEIPKTSTGKILKRALRLETRA
ncbi:AMP-binding protein [Nocardioides sp. KIGAM211]|uniref:AMP-binding protein n=1 Tax=Nocardioides luti TaxID=2761101 RepID=A0A7X0RKH0_9ACTN|nr:AMP-binding protein [Nocardioides luti]